MDGACRHVRTDCFNLILVHIFRFAARVAATKFCFPPSQCFSSPARWSSPHLHRRVAHRLERETFSSYSPFLITSVLIISCLKVSSTASYKIEERCHHRNHHCENAQHPKDDEQCFRRRGCRLPSPSPPCPGRGSAVSSG